MGPTIHYYEKQWIVYNPFVHHSLAYEGPYSTKEEAQQRVIQIMQKKGERYSLYGKDDSMWVYDNVERKIYGPLSEQQKKWLMSGGGQHNTQDRFRLIVTGALGFLVGHKLAEELGKIWDNAPEHSEAYDAGYDSGYAEGYEDYPQYEDTDYDIADAGDIGDADGGWFDFGFF